MATLKRRITVANSFFEAYDAHENGLIEKYRLHPFFQKGIRKLGDRDFFYYLLELGYLSSHFIRWMELAKNQMRTENAKEPIRIILRDEIPSQGNSHQDDRMQDLYEIADGLDFPTEWIRHHKPSVATLWTVKRLYGGIRHQIYCDLQVNVFVRVAGEVLVGETYRFVAPELKRRFGMGREESVFYWPHFDHDQKRFAEGDGGHTEVSTELLQTLIVNKGDLSFAGSASTEAFDVRYKFHNQFLPPYWFLRGRGYRRA